MNQLRNYFVLAVLVLSACILYILKSKTDEPVPTRRTVTIPKIEIEEDVRGNIVIIIDDFGYRDDIVSEGFLSLDADITFAIIPGHQNSKVFAAKADQNGYEVIVHMPMESTNETRGEKEYKLVTSMTVSYTHLTLPTICSV